MQRFAPNQSLFQLLLRIWFGLVMMYNGRFIFTYSTDTFWHGFFADHLHFPFPDLMFFLAKGSEFFGGLFLFLGLFTRISAAMVAFTMMMATVFANISQLYGGYGSMTFSYFLFAVLFVIVPIHSRSIDRLIWRSKLNSPGSFMVGERTVRIFLICMRAWFASLLLYNGVHSALIEPSGLYFNWMFEEGRLANHSVLVWLLSIAEIISGLFIITGLFTRKICLFIAIYLVAIIIASGIARVRFESFQVSMICILFWFACIFCFPVGSAQNKSTFNQD